MKNTFDFFFRTIRYLVLMTIMTTVWILDIYIWIKKEDSCEPQYNFEVISLIKDVFNLSQGIVIFLMFVWCKKVTDTIWKRFIESP